MIDALPPRLHLVGIGGAGLSAIARVLMAQGHSISGSDRAASPLLDALAAEGAHVFIGHAAAQIAGADALIVTSAAPLSNPEIAAAHAAGIPVYKRSDIIAAVMRDRTAVCVAGTHGKTTTTGMIAHILMTAGRDPSFIVGSTVASLGTNAHHGQGDAFVIEADEYDHMFLGLRPHIALVNNIEWDHPDCFPTPGDFTAAFDHFVDRLPADGVLVYNADDPGASTLAGRIADTGRRVVPFSYQGGIAAGLGAVITLAGRHNVQNAAGALAVAGVLGIPAAAAITALTTFTGTGRRFEVRHDDGHIALIDDYAHHPTAIRATLQAARSRYAGRAVWAVWQPHTFSRTAALLNDYAAAFSEADGVIVTEIYAAREAPLPGITGAAVAAAITHPVVHHAATLKAAAALLAAQVTAPAVVVILSAGDAPQIVPLYLALRFLPPHPPA